MAAHEEKSRNICLSCDQCDYKSNIKRRIRDHMVKHTSNRPKRPLPNVKYPCNHCSKVFDRFASRAVHERAKHLNLEYVCECGKAFSSYWKLYSHRNNDHIDLQLKCQRCEKVFHSKTRLKFHFDRFHAQKSPCEVCGKMMAPGIAMRSHKKTVHSEQVRCEFEGCGNKCAFPNHLHKKILRTNDIEKLNVEIDG